MMFAKILGLPSLLMVMIHCKATSSSPSIKPYISIIRASRFDKHNEEITVVTDNPPNQVGIHQRRRPAFEKIVIGPLMVLGEKFTGGHYLEVLRLGKQMAIGSTQESPSYFDLHKNFVSEGNGYIGGAFYRGFFPWSLLECLKGMPVLFAQNEFVYQLKTKTGLSEKKAERVSGFLSGATQAFFVCPLQKIKVAVVASTEINSLSPFQASKKVIDMYGISSLYDGLMLTMVRRSIDWGIRFGVSTEMSRFLIRRKGAINNKDSLKESRNTVDELGIFGLMISGLVGGAASAITHPIDNIITNSQKPLNVGAATDMLSVVQRMVNENGRQAFTTGFLVKVIDNAYHTAWVYGVGTLLYDRIRRKKII